VIYAFEDFNLDPGRRELRRGTELVAIEPQVFDILVYLIRNRDRVVSSDDLIAAIWTGRIVSESTLSSRITAVRHAVDDSGEHQRLIRTVIRKGFRFVGDVREKKDTGEDNSAAEDKGAPPAATHAPVTAGLTLPDKPSIAVLPFTNMSGDPDQEYFADGITEDLTTALSQFRWLFVIARSSSFTYKGRAVDASTCFIRSPSLTIPTTAPFGSTTGAPLMRFAYSNFAISRTGVSGATAITLVVMISAAVNMASSGRFRDWT
jgi:DNA-binding winged helix-turn-helix (wHTH) protein